MTLARRNASRSVPACAGPGALSWSRAAAGPCAAALVLAALVAAAAAAATGTGTFRTRDGRRVSAVLNDVDTRPPSAVVLVPMLGGTTEDWGLPAERFGDGSYNLGGGPPRAGGSLVGGRLIGWHTDVAAVAWLHTRVEAPASAIGVAGGSLGGNLTVLAAAADAQVRSLALLSPSLDYRDVRVEAPLRLQGPPGVSRRQPARPIRRGIGPAAGGGSPGIREVAPGRRAGARQPLLGSDRGNPPAAGRVVSTDPGMK